MAFRAQRAKFGLEGGDSGAVVFSPAGLRPLRLFASEALLFSLCLRIHLFFFFFLFPALLSHPINASRCSGWARCIHAAAACVDATSAGGRMLRRATASRLFVSLRCNRAPLERHQSEL